MGVKAQRVSVEKQTKSETRYTVEGDVIIFVFFFPPNSVDIKQREKFEGEVKDCLKITTTTTTKPDIQEIQKDASQLSGEGEGLHLALIYLQL